MLILEMIRVSNKNVIKINQYNRNIGYQKGEDVQFTWLSGFFSPMSK